MPGLPGSYGRRATMTAMFEACLQLPRDPREARLLADALDALARALRDWPADAWRTVADQPAPAKAGLFERLVARAAPAALDARQRPRLLASAAAVADVLRVLWPAPTAVSEPAPLAAQAA